MLKLIAQAVARGSGMRPYRREKWAISAGRTSSRRNRALKRGRVVVSLPTDGRTALGAHVVVLATAREDEQELFAGRRRLLAGWAEETGGLELAETVSWGRHSADFKAIMPSLFP